MLEPLTSLFQRELTILSKNFGQCGRTCWELSRLLLRAREEYDKDGFYKGESGAEAGGQSGPPAMVDSVSVPDEPSYLQEEFDEICPS